MKISLKVREMLLWHDTPQLFTAKDKIGGLFVCLAVEDNGGQSQFLAVAVSTNRLQELKTGKIDLYTVFVSPLARVLHSTGLPAGTSLFLKKPYSQRKTLHDRWYGVSDPYHYPRVSKTHE
jgi:hypothetical protein